MGVAVIGEAPGLLSGVHPHLKPGSWGSFGGLPQSGGCPGTGWGTRRHLPRCCAEGTLWTPGPLADPLPGSETHALGIPDTSLSGRSTRTALSVRRSNSVPTVAKMLEERSQNGKQGRFQGQVQTDGQGCLGFDVVIYQLGDHRQVMLYRWASVSSSVLRSYLPHGITCGLQRLQQVCTVDDNKCWTEKNGNSPRACSQGDIQYIL